MASAWQELSTIYFALIYITLIPFLDFLQISNLESVVYILACLGRFFGIII
jgi:hypothetical protein